MQYLLLHCNATQAASIHLLLLMLMLMLLHQPAR